MHQGALIEDPEPDAVKAFARELEDGQAVDSVFVVRDRSRRERKDGESFLRLRFSDVTGTVEGIAWDDADTPREGAGVGAIVRVQGRYAVDSRHGGRIIVRAMRVAADHEWDERDLHAAPPHPYEAMVRDMRDLIATVQNPHLRALLDSFFGEGSAEWARWREAPAAKHYHQAYRHGLLEHCLSVAQGVSALSATFPGIDRDVAVTGALLHDIGKIDAYASTGASIEMTDAGKLLGEISLGYYMIRRRIEDLPGLPGGSRAGGAAHHPEPPRQARARLAGHPLHARGDARAHGRQPRRNARLVRPDREDARRRRGVVGLRPRDLLVGLLRAARRRGVAQPAPRSGSSAVGESSGATSPVS